MLSKKFHLLPTCIVLVSNYKLKLNKIKMHLLLMTNQKTRCKVCWIFIIKNELMLSKQHAHITGNSKIKQLFEY